MSAQAPKAQPISTVVTFLEMTKRPRHLSTDLSVQNVRMEHVPRPEIPFYRHLYDTVGRDYLWVNRKHWTDEKLASTIHDDGVEIHCLYAGHKVAGFTELDFRLTPDTEITFFGLMPDFVGKGLSRPFLTAVLHEAWRPHIDRVHLQTCTCDHPAALPLYQKMGFTAFGRTTETLIPYTD